MNMTDEEMNRQIAEFCGVKYQQPTEEELASGCYYQYEPDYVNNLNTMHAAEKLLTDAQRWNYIRNLACTFADHPDDGMAKAVTATSRQRAESLLRVIPNAQGSCERQTP